MSDRPTDKAIQEFDKAGKAAHLAVVLKDSHPEYLAHAVHYLANGLTDLATGLRATYMLLEEVRDQLKRQKL
jgi:hypothetical protein